MRFCAICQRIMLRDPSSGIIVFKCACGVEEKGEPFDARISGAILDAGETTEMYEKLIRGAPFDRTNQIVKRQCMECGLNYMVQIRVGISEIIVYKCKCGYEDIGGNK